ncbi:hypothetical protein [Aggregatibacter actinomycetemcomitans]|uniref:hypothetical protein n=1 Tax=Aggregatibacter actinomycetemcomitans TaxID=714 RepID=UPI00022AE08B|nr:hypothetical protein [Aggregatibacter actinomycetemcomitans]KOE63898.1 hypothetical protein SCC393_0311080 [Aggregatibacter actinomycetemcomitans serotype e str. SCC393]KOE67411.1 hypothetical protein A160_0201965 [Aggregatibacter actinomycetemcomitans serotype e str. A160]KYK78334.1 hypothetical protein SA2876_04160 [Aggregatibacter actinomycetemcomitans serotype e str. SA2876]
MTDKTYEFRNVTDILELTDEQFERFLEDFKIWFKFQKEAREKLAHLNKLGFVNVSLADVIRWKDDHQTGINRFNGKININDHEVYEVIIN